MQFGWHNHDHNVWKFVIKPAIIMGTLVLKQGKYEVSCLHRDKRLDASSLEEAKKLSEEWIERVVSTTLSELREFLNVRPY